MSGILDNSGALITRFVAPMEVRSNQPVFVSDTISLKRQVVSQGVQRWEITTNVEPSNYSADLLIHSVTNGYDQVIDIRMPQVFRRNGVRSTGDGYTRCASFAVAGAGTVSLTDNADSTIYKGEFIKFANRYPIFFI